MSREQRTHTAQPLSMRGLLREQTGWEQRGSPLGTPTSLSRPRLHLRSERRRAAASSFFIIHKRPLDPREIPRRDPDLRVHSQSLRRAVSFLHGRLLTSSLLLISLPLFCSLSLSCSRVSCGAGTVSSTLIDLEF
jgi:hypothetical protein